MKTHFNLFFLMTLLALAQTAYGAKKTFYSTPAKLQTTQIQANSSLQVVDPELNVFSSSDTTWRRDIYNLHHVGLVELKINNQNLNSAYQNKDYTVTIKVHLTGRKFNSTTGFFETFDETKFLQVDFKQKGPFTSQAFIEIEGAIDLTATVLECHSFPLNAVMNLELTAKIDIERFYQFDPTQIGVTSSRIMTNSGETKDFEINWTPIPNAEYYELEWTYIDNYKEGTSNQTVQRHEIPFTESFFKNNSTRINTYNNQFRIPNVYGQGFLLYRVRALGYGLWVNPAVNGNPIEYHYTKSPVPGAWFGLNCQNSDCDIPNTKLSDFIGQIGEEIEGYLFLNTQILDNKEVAIEINSEDYIDTKRRFNYEFSTSFAEDGKYASNLVFYDGSLKNRQTISRAENNDNAKVIVSENIYDFQGRNVIQTLPVPLNSNRLEYTPELNMAIDGSGGIVDYSPSLFDLDQNNCSIEAIPMDPNSGSSKYYSINIDPELKLEQENADYIPIASNFPFVQTRFMPDNTGRIASQSQPGATFKLGSGKETKYFYDVPDQRDLDRIFGNDAGDASHYKKNIVRDPNGQYSLSIVNLEGKTVATGLLGSNPENLIALESKSSTEYAMDLLNKSFFNPLGSRNNIDLNRMGIYLNRPLFISEEKIYEFGYGYGGNKYTSDCPVETQRCYDCVMNLKISLKDECGNEYLYGYENALNKTPIIIGESILNQLRGNINSLNCTAAVAPLTYKLGLKNYTDKTTDNTFKSRKSTLSPTSLNVGIYNLSKSLEVNQEALELYTQNFLSSSCFKTLTQFENEAIEALDLDGCEITCEQCSTQVNTFVSNHTDLTTEEISGLYAKCIDYCGTPTNYCDNIKEALLIDMEPMGQYGQFIKGGVMLSDNKFKDFENEQIDPNISNVSIFNSNNLLPRNPRIATLNATTNAPTYNKAILMTSWAPNWRFPFNESALANTEKSFSYLNQNGEIDYVFITKLGNDFYPPVSEAYVNEIIKVDEKTFKVKPNYLANVGDFISLFKPSWANSLLAYHPEYEYNRLCTFLKSSYDYDAQLEKITTFDDAKKISNGIDQFMTPLGTSFSSSNAQDPFFNTSSYTGAPTGFIITSNLYNKMVDLMANFAFHPITNLPISMAEAAYFLTNCPDGQNGNCDNCDFVFGVDEFSKNSNTQNQTWIAYRSMYLGTKRRLVEYLIHDFAINNGFYNGCIGKENFSAVENNFLGTFFNNPLAGANNWYNSQFFNPVQPCNCSDYSLYKEKTARFFTQKDKTELGSLVDKFCKDANNLPTNCGTQFTALKDELHKKNSQVGLTNCGQCPDAFGFENLFNALIKNEEFDTEGNEIILVCYNGLESNGVNGYAEMTYDMAKKLFPSITNQNYTMNYRSEYNNTTHKLEAKFILNNGAEECNFEFTFPEYYANSDMYSFNDIESMCCLQGIQILNTVGTLNGPYAVEATVQIKVKDTDLPHSLGVSPFYNEWTQNSKKNLTITGTTSCLSIAVCSPSIQCQPTNEALYLLNFLNNMKRATILFPVSSSANVNINNLLNKGSVTSPYNGLFANGEFFDFLSNKLLFNQYGYRDNQTQNYNHISWFSTINSANNECEFVLTNRTDPAFTGKSDVICSMIMSILPADINSFYLQNIISFLGMEYIGNELFVNVITENPNLAGTFLFKKVKLTSHCITLGVCGDKIRNFNRISKISAGGNGGTPPPGPAAECDECRLNKAHLNPFKDWFNLLLHQNNKAEPYDSFYTLSNEYRWSNYSASIPTNKRHPLNMPITNGSNSCGSDMLLINLTHIYNPLTGISEPILNCPSNDFDCVITLHTIPAKFIKDVVNILSISRPPGKPYSYFEMIGENIRGDKVVIYGNSPCMDICEMNCGSGSGDCGFFDQIGFNGLNVGYTTDFVHELDLNNNDTLSDDLPTITNNITLIENEYCLFNNTSFIFTMMPNQTTYKKLWKFGDNTSLGKSLKSNTKYKATFTIYYSDGASQPEIDAFMSINGKVLSANKQRIESPLSVNDFKVTYTYYYKTPYGNGNGSTINIPLEIFVLNSSSFFNPKGYLLYEIGVEESCEPDIPCCILPQPEFEIESPCSSMVYIAKANARELYNAYLHRTREGFKAAYIKKCLTAYEGFYMKQLDEKYHYTLYYYDQAGNLVRTIPPSGFTPLTNAEIQQVDLDRAADTRTIFTNHNLATTYKYNSLNQLVEQTVPDNRDMDLIIQQNLSNGIPSGLTIRGIQSISESHAYLFADDNTANNYSRIFSTHDGGKSWQEHSDIGIRQLNKIQVVNPNIQYAIGEEGLFLKSENGGVDWQIKFIPSSSRLGQIYFIEPDKGMVFEESGMFYKTTDGGNTWTGPYNFLQKQFASGAKLNSISCHFNQIYAINHLGEIFFSNNWGVIWENQIKIRTKSAFTSASFLSNNSGFVAGENGLLLKGHLNTQTQWQAINTGISDHFVKIKFFTETFGVAIVKYFNSSVAFTKLQYTNNGGNTWSNSNVPSPYGSNQRFVDMSFINASTGYALTEAGKILKTTDAGVNWTLVNFTSPYNSPVLASSFGLIAVNSNLFAFMGASNGDIYKADLNASSITWSNFLGSSKPSISSGVTQIHAMNSTRIIYTLATGNAFTFTEGSSSVAANLNNTSNTKIMGLNFASGASNGFLLVQNQGSDYDYFVAKYTDAASSPLIEATSPIEQTETGDAAFLYVNTQINEVAMVGFSSGELFARELDNCTTPSVCNWSNVGERILAGSLADIDYYKDSSIISSSLLVSSRAVATGANGKVLIKNLSLPYWTLLPFVCKTDYSQAKIAPSIIGVDPPVDVIALVGSGNYFGKISIDRLGDYSPSNSNYSNVSNYITTATENYVLNDLQFWVNQSSEPYFLACGKNTSTNKRAVLTAHITPGFNLTEVNIPSTNVPDYAIAFKSIGMWNSSTSSEINYTVVGEEGKRVQKVETTFSEQMARPNRVNATQMINANLGYAVGNGGKIYQTTDGAKTWQLLPGNTGITDNLSSVHFITSQLGFITGSSGLYRTTNGLDFSLVSGYSFGALRDIHFNAGFGILVGEGGVIYYSVNSGNTWTQISNSITTNLNAAFVTGANPNMAGGNALAFVVGNSGTILGIFKNGSTINAINQTSSGNSWVFANYNNNNNLNDVYFDDFNTGYIVGDGGVCMKTTNGKDAFTNNSQWAKIVLNGPSSNFRTLFPKNNSQFLLAGSNGVVKNINDRSDKLSSRFFYDAVGRLVASQNSKQYYEATSNWNTYSYTLYDAQGRIYEVGQISSQTPIEELYEGQILNSSLFNAWIISSSNTRTEVTKTFYDEMYFPNTPLGIPPYLNKRVSSTAVYEIYTGNIHSYQSATHYSYDIHGNVNKLLQDNPSLEAVGSRYKLLEYNYDELTGKVIQVDYQKGKEDKFSHHYEYDNLNRIVGVYTSNKTSVFTGEQYHSLWQKDARYSYYLHGPLARTELGNDKVQGVDYAYTLQGWLKGVNSATLVASRDMGKDGCQDCGSQINSNFAPDEMGFVLGYHENDYKQVGSINSINHFEVSLINPSNAAGELSTTRKNLYNGNISYMSTAIGKFMEGVDPLPNTFVYEYDQLNRLKNTKRFTNLNRHQNYWTTTSQSNTDYNESYNFDANGNILNLQRNGTVQGGSNAMDNFTYFYEGINHNQKKKTNKLLSVADNVSSYSLPGYEDLKPGQSYSPNTITGNNYSYDAIGNLVSDKQEEIENIKWNIYGKISEITRTPGSLKPNLSFIYSSAGQRIGKVVKPAGSAPADWDYTYYILDAQGNTMSTYNLKGINIYQDRIYLYGSSRLGELVPHKKSNSLCGTLINDNDLIGNRSAYIESFLKNVFVNVNNPNFTSQAITFWINHWDAYFHVHSNQFSVEVNNMATHQFMWNEWVAWLCKLNRFETLNEQIFSLWDAEWQTRMEPFISHQINCSQETCPEMYQNLLPLWRTNEELMITAWEGLGFTNNYNLRRNTYVKGSRHYELSNHLGNVLTVVSDRKIEHDERYAFAQGGGYKYENGAYHLDAAGSFAQLSASDGIISHYTAELISATDYYAFGAPMPERTWQGGEYRFGFNGQEKDDEVSDAGNSYTAEFWQYDPRLGRRFNVDPKPNPSISVYAAFANNPIFLIDINGDTVYQFNSNLKYIGFKDDGKVEITGSILNKKGKSVYQFNFNDPANDAAALRNKEITGLQIMSENDFNYAIEKSGVKDKKSKIDAVKYATEEGPAGKAMDYSKYFSGTKLTIFKGGSTAYNKFDAGNFMWGYGMNQLGFSEFTAQWGAEAAAFAWGKKWYPPTFGERGHGEDWDDNAKVWESKWWNQKSWTGDSGADQKAIQEGYRYNKP